ncbi:MAG: sigma-54 dependent transcriptional regulator [candidate division Zixibacteria bacterium]|nr:sigma-54 dependent transcriptional regulator [candidate division Zixibacteria bacterium]
MNPVGPTILLFAQKEYPFLQGGVPEAHLVVAAEPAELMETVKQDHVAIIMFDTAHPKFNDSLVMRIYRRTPNSEFWLLADSDGHRFPEYVVDAVLPPGIERGEFEKKTSTCLRVKALLEEYHLVGKSPQLKRTADMIAQVAPTDISTLIIGPSGSGKELVARAVHQHSARRTKPFVAVNCGALAEGLLESELFGHEKGSFTGAIGRREGIFKRADGGTVFLDEIGETTPALQVKLLRALEEGSFYRVGGEEIVHTNVRIVAATNRELTEAIAEGRFREDLYYRLGTFRINLTGLHERKADIIPLINHFFIEQTGATRGLSERAMELLTNFGWPGNVRQVKNFVSRVVVSAPEGEISEQLATQFMEEQGYVERNLPVVTGKTPQQAEFQLIYQALLSLGQEVRILRDLIVDNLPSRRAGGMVDANVHDGDSGTMEKMEEDLIRQTLASVGGNRREAARRLGIGERTLYRKLKKFDSD